jgi:hypothetical protein
LGFRRADAPRRISGAARRIFLRQHPAFLDRRLIERIDATQVRGDASAA